MTELDTARAGDANAHLPRPGCVSRFAAIKLRKREKNENEKCSLTYCLCQFAVDVISKSYFQSLQSLGMLFALQIEIRRSDGRE